MSSATDAEALVSRTRVKFDVWKALLYSKQPTSVLLSDTQSSTAKDVMSLVYPIRKALAKTPNELTKPVPRTTQANDVRRSQDVLLDDILAVLFPRMSVDTREEALPLVCELIFQPSLDLPHSVGGVPLDVDAFTEDDNDDPFANADEFDAAENSSDIDSDRAAVSDPSQVTMINVAATSSDIDMPVMASGRGFYDPRLSLRELLVLRLDGRTLLSRSTLGSNAGTLGAQLI